MKRWITLLIAVLMMASVLPVGGLAEGTDSQMTPSGIAYEDIGASVGAYIAEMNGVDLIVFTAGIGENNPRLRRHICENLSYMGVKIDADANDGARSSETIISTPDSSVTVALIPTNEELVIARDTMRIVTELEN